LSLRHGSLQIIRLIDANEVIRTCRISSDRTAGFVSDKLENTLVAEHVTVTTNTHTYTHIHIYILQPNSINFYSNVID